MKDSSDLEIKRKIYDLIVKNPGLHASQIAELLEISWELVYYHISYLEKNGLINIVKKEGYSRCFATGEVGEKDRNILSVLRQKKPLLIYCSWLCYCLVVQALDLRGSKVIDSITMLLLQAHGVHKHYWLL